MPTSMSVENARKYQHSTPCISSRRSHTSHKPAFMVCVKILLTILVIISCLYSHLFTVISRHSEVRKIKAIIAARPTTVAVLFANSHIRTLRQEPCHPLRLILSDNGTAGLQKYLRQVRRNTSFAA
jgi:hypothetical protein